MKEHRLLLPFAVAVSLISIFAPIGAHGATTFRDRASWSSGIATASTIDFTTNWLGAGQQTDYTSGGLTDSGVHFSSAGLYVIAPQSYYSSVFLYDGSGLLTLTLPTGTTAIGMDLISQVGGINDIAITAFLADSGTIGDSYSGSISRDFWGITSNVPISTLTISSSARWLGVDNLSVGTVPEPTSAMLILIGGALCSRRRTLRTHNRTA